MRFHAEEEANDREFAKQLRATGATSILRSRRCWNGDAIPKQALRATWKPARSLVRCSQVAHCLHHYAAVDLVVLYDLAHEHQVRERYALILAPPRADHRPQAVSRPVVPKRVDETVTVHRFRDRLETEPERPAHYDRLLAHHLAEEVEPSW